MTDRGIILAAITAERERQDSLWGDQSGHTDEYWTAILTEEVGEAAQEVLHRDTVKLMIELTQVAAVTVQWMEALLKRAKNTTEQTS